MTGTPNQPVPAEETRPNGLEAVSCPLNAQRVKQGEKNRGDTQRLELLRRNLHWDGYGYWLPELCVKSRELGQGQEFLPEPTLAELRAALDEAHGSPTPPVSRNPQE